MVTANVVDLYPGIPHKACLETLKKRLDERETCEITTQDILQMTEFVLKNDIVEFNGEVSGELKS